MTPTPHWSLAPPGPEPQGDRIARIITNLTHDIPRPYRPPPKSQKSWATLKVGDQLARSDVTSLKPEQVASCDNQGCTMASGLRLEDRNWKATWAKVPKKRKRKDQNE